MSQLCKFDLISSQISMCEWDDSFWKLKPLSLNEAFRLSLVNTVNFLTITPLFMVVTFFIESVLD